MKKMLLIAVIACVLLACPNLASAAPVFTYQELGQDATPLLPNIGNYRYEYLFEFQGHSYRLSNSNQYRLPVKYDPALVQKFGINGEYTWTGEYYFVRNNQMDGVWMSKDYYIQPIRLYDANLNLVKEYKFEQHVMEAGYYGGAYYCRLYGQLRNQHHYPEQVMKSTDFENWEETEEDVPHKVEMVTFAGNKVALHNTTSMLPVSYEDGKEKTFYSTMGEWILKRDSDLNFYLSNDNVYFAKIEYPQELREYDKRWELGYDFRGIYEHENNIVIDLYRNGSHKFTQYDSQEETNAVRDRFDKVVRLTVPKQEVYAELEAQKTSPYVKVADEILGFETPPITESDRTLVPMRFLFEKLGAEVSWDQETETATAQKANTVLSFSIDQNNAVVNGQPAAMDVPARLVNDKTMVPLRFLSENLGYTVEWDEATRMATIKE